MWCGTSPARNQTHSVVSGGIVKRTIPSALLSRPSTTASPHTTMLPETAGQACIDDHSCISYDFAVRSQADSCSFYSGPPSYPVVSGVSFSSFSKPSATCTTFAHSLIVLLVLGLSKKRRCVSFQHTGPRFVTAGGTVACLSSCVVPLGIKRRTCRFYSGQRMAQRKPATDTEAPFVKEGCDLTFAWREYSGFYPG